MNVKTIARTRAWFIFAILLVFIPGFGQAEPHKPHPGETASEIFIFGDSLADPGNILFLTGQVSIAPFAVIPAAPYDGGRFSNGPTWAEQLARKLRRPDSGAPAYSNPSMFGNFAAGGARARAVGAAPHLSDQVGLFLFANGFEAPSDALYIVQFGGNDIRDALSVFNPGDISPSFAIINEAVQTTVFNIELLRMYGARKFLVANVPNLGKAPAILFAGPGAVGAATFLSANYNGLLEGGLQTVEGNLAYGDVEILRLDMFGFIDAVTVAPEAFGFADATTPCLSFGVPVNAICGDPDSHVFWDGIHPTAAMHIALGNAAVKVLRKAEILSTAGE